MSATTAWNTHTLFFYGTLVHPAILERVIGNPGAHLRVRNALLPAHATSHVSGVDYPALVSLEDRQPQLVSDPSIVTTQAPADAILAVPNSTTPSSSSGVVAAVPGTVVSGLTDKDLRYLDLFEGDEYIRKTVDVLPVDPEGISNALRPRDASLADILVDLGPDRCTELLRDADHAPKVAAQAYVWCAPLGMLEDRRWIFAEFAREKAKRWVGAQADHEYTDVDRERAP